MSLQHKTVMMIVVVLLAVLVEALGQAPCGCAPKPTIIQLSCGRGSVAPQQQPLAAPAAPAPAAPSPATDFNTNQTSSHVEEGYSPSIIESEATTAATTDFDVRWCNQDGSGGPGRDGSPPGGFPEGFRWKQSCAAPCYCDHPSVWVGNNNNNQRVPPMHWNGDLEALHFDIGKPGEPTYNMVMCWPIKVRDDCEQWAPLISSFNEN